MDKLRDIFYAPSRRKAMEEFHKFVGEYDSVIPSAVKSLKNNIDSCLTFYSFPKEEWISLRTTNVIERVNKEFKRRTKPIAFGVAKCTAGQARRDIGSAAL